MIMIRDVVRALIPLHEVRTIIQLGWVHSSRCQDGKCASKRERII